MYDKRDDIEQAEWCSEWSRRRWKRRHRRLQRWSTFKMFCVAALYEFAAMVKGE